MSLDKIKSGRMKEPLKIFTYGTNGIGKSTFIAQAPNSIILDIEGGTGHINTSRFEKKDLATYTDVKLALTSLVDEPHDYKFVGIDTLDWLEQLIFSHTCKTVMPEKDYKSIEEYGYGKGYVFAQKYWLEFISILEQLRALRGMNIILTAHSLVRTFNPPDSDPYDRYQPDLHKDSFSLLRDWCDALIFFNYKVYTRKVESKKTKQGVGEGERVMFCQERPAYWAKNRWNLPVEIPFDEQTPAFAAFSQYYAQWVASGSPDSK